MSLVPVINVREGWKGSRMVHEGDILSILRNNIGSTTPFAFGTLCLHICDSCQLRCGYCNYKDSKRPVFLDEKPVALLRQLEFLNVVIVGGGEPTFPELLPSAADLIEAATMLVANAERLGLSNFLATRTNLANLSTFFSDRTYLQPTTSKCYYSLLYLLVKANGDVYPCGSMAFRSLNRLGNANDGDIDSITNNARRFHELNTPESNPACVGCWDDHINVALQKFLGGEPPPRVCDELLFPYPFSRFWG
jgi:radical SAM protein with 4Fe4S-binding SPASM domain